MQFCSAIAQFAIHLAVFLWINPQSQASLTGRFTQNTNLTGHYSSFWMFQQSALRHPATVLQCAAKCLQDSRCNTFMVNLDWRLCRRHAARVTHHNTLEPGEGFMSFDSNTAVPLIGLACVSNSTCLAGLANSQCEEHTCQCQPGYGFSPALKSCVANCPEYGTEFVSFKDYFISDNNDRELDDPQFICPGCCFSACVNEKNFLCRSVETTPDYCYLSSVTRLDMPTEYNKNEVSHVTYHQRQCKP